MVPSLHQSYSGASMNLQDLVGKPLPDFFRDRTFGLFDGIMTTILVAGSIYVFRRYVPTARLVTLSLRLRIVIMTTVIWLIVLASALLGAAWYYYIIAAILALYSSQFWILRDLSRVGILNAFETTRKGISADRSLDMVKKNLDFLGIGGAKLTDSKEFDKMLDRCKQKGGRLRFLLSSPDNPALDQLATSNSHHSRSYQSRVRESIREIITRSNKPSVNCEVRIYSLSHKIALPHFRLFFIDEKYCLFSQLVWNSSEGADNPQVILRRDSKNSSSSLYIGYMSYFDDLWNSPDTKVVDQALIDSWP
jgi:hypothetical protein